MGIPLTIKEQKDFFDPSKGFIEVSLYFSGTIEYEKEDELFDNLMSREDIQNEITKEMLEYGRSLELSKHLIFLRHYGWAHSSFSKLPRSAYDKIF